jgi:L-malate glycosyltransferase
VNILHLTPHLGGGVGRVLLAWLSRANTDPSTRHEIYSLESVSPATRDKAAQGSIPLHVEAAGRLPELFAAISGADIVLVHWWNHPLLYSLLVNERLPPCRLALWSHVAGHTAPHIFTDNLINFTDRFVVATPWSFEAPALRALDPALLRGRVREVFTTAGTGRVEGVRPLRHEGFAVGYIGTVDYCKLHPSFIAMCAAANIPDARFIVCGGDCHREIGLQAERKGVAGRFTFIGPVDDIREQLARFDVFGYPLCQGHYGTGEQALIEAQAAGIPAVVFANGGEKYVVEHEWTGLVVTSTQEYTAALERLYRDPELRRRLGDNAAKRASSRFSLDKLLKSWNALFEELVALPKRTRSWPAHGPLKGARLFLESLGDAAGLFAVSFRAGENDALLEAETEIGLLDGIFRSPTRGSSFHYRTHFPDDPHLNLWCGLIELAAGDPEQALASLTKCTIDHPRIAAYRKRAIEAMHRSSKEVPWAAVSARTVV